MAQATRRHRSKAKPTWWLGNRRYFGYMMRELSSLFVLIYVLVFVGLLLLVGDPAGYGALVAVVESPLFAAFTVVALAFVLWHGITWWHLNAKVLPVRVAGRPLPPRLLFAGGLLVWLLVSVIAYLLLFRGL